MKDETLITTAGRHPEDNHGIVNPPVYHASTILFPSLEAAENPYKSRVTYGRHGTPGTFALEEAMTTLEGAACTYILPSGLAACTEAILACVAAGDHVLVTDSVYEPTRIFCDRFLKRFGVETTYYDPLIGEGIAKLIRPNTKVVFTEAPGSRTFEIQDIPAIAHAAHAAGDIFVLMDNTWATPLYFKPLAHGVDLSIQAATKYIVGHSDAMLGTISANERAATRLRDMHRLMGMAVGPDDVYLALRGLRTLAARLKQHGETGLELATWLKARPEVDRVLHPGLYGDPGHEIWSRDFKGASGLFGFVLKPCSKEQLKAFIEPMKLFKIGYSWGGFESLITSGDPSRARTATKWVGPGPLVRVHAGLEHVDDLLADLEGGFKR
ncbi:MAG: cystathionine beta-lyase, partial [Alphaproteobacteria bacterium]